MADVSRALSFGTIATDYHRYRPRTPPAMLDWLMPASAQRVVDLAAGTGALTELLVTRVPLVTAVEPDPGMRSVLAEAAPGAAVLAGTAEAIPLPDEHADAVFVSSAWHWFDPARAVPEIARVLRDGGRLCVLGNGVDPRVEWVRALRDLFRSRPSAPRTPRRQVVLPEGSPFGEPDRNDVSWMQTMSADDVVNLLGTFSAVIVATVDEKEQIRQRARTLLAQHPATRGREDFEVSMRSWGWRATRLARDASQ